MSLGRRFGFGRFRSFAAGNHGLTAGTARPRHLGVAFGNFGHEVGHPALFNSLGHGVPSFNVSVPSLALNLISPNIAAGV